MPVLPPNTESATQPSQTGFALTVKMVFIYIVCQIIVPSAVNRFSIFSSPIIAVLTIIASLQYRKSFQFHYEPYGPSKELPHRSHKCFLHMLLYCLILISTVLSNTFRLRYQMRHILESNLYNSPQLLLGPGEQQKK